MDLKNKKNISIILIVIIVLLTIILFFSTALKNKKENLGPQSTDKNTTETQQPKKEDGNIPLTEEKKAELAVIKNISGKVISVDISAIKIKTTEEGELSFKVPRKGASFTTQTLQQDGGYLVEEIGLLQIKKDKEVEVQYNSQTMEVMLVKVK